MKDFVPPDDDDKENRPPSPVFSLGDFQDWHDFIAGLYDEENELSPIEDPRI